MGKIKTSTMDIPSETAEPCLEIPPHFEKVIIDAFVHKFIFLSLDFVTQQLGSQLRQSGYTTFQFGNQLAQGIHCTIGIMHVADTVTINELPRLYLQLVSYQSGTSAVCTVEGSSRDKLRQLIEYVAFVTEFVF